MPLPFGSTPSAPAGPSSPWTVTISARTPPALTITKASDATPVIHACANIDRWMDFIAPPAAARPPATQPDNIQLRFEHYKAEISMPGHIGV
jgi:hypothetical protein